MDNDTSVPIMDEPAVNENTGKQFLSRKLVIIFVLVLSCILLILAVVKFFLNPTSHNVNKPTAMRIYQDKSHYFTIQLPATWQETMDTAQGSTEVGSNEETTQNIEEVQMNDGKDTGIAVQVYEGKPNCPLGQPLTTTIAGYPASYDDTMNTWTIPTTKALITVTITYPGSGGVQQYPPQLTQNAATPVPSAVAEQNKNAVMEILKTLKLTGLTTFSC